MIKWFYRGAIVALIISNLTTLYFYKDQRVALDMCVDDVANKCGHILQYAASLENENAKLNMMCDRLRPSPL